MKRRILSIITALALCLSLCPTWAFATEADPSLCKHHPAHTADCGYTAPAEGHDCGHEHTEDCYTTDEAVGKVLDCRHSHDSACGYVQGDPGAPCGYVCRICPIEALIAALPDKVTEDNAEEVRAQLDRILDLYRELDEDEQEEINLSRIYALQGALDAANDPAPAEESVTYQEASWNGSEVTYTGKTENCTSVESSTEAVTWDVGWYVANSTVTIFEPITVTGAVNLILGDGCTLNAEKGIVVTTGNSLTIYAQSGGTGTLNATGTTDSNNNASAGIGGSTSSLDSSTITIHGGVINATGGVVNDNFGDPNYGAAGIGGGTSRSGNGGSSGAVIIYGGTVTANSGAGSVTGAGIGGGGSGQQNGGAGNDITIYGGSVTAASTGANSGGAGIGGGGGLTGGGAGNNIQIYGGTINATGSEGGAGIGGGGAGAGGTSGAGTNITISGGIVIAVGGTNAAGIGGGGGYSTQYISCTGGAGSVTITGGIVDAKGGAGNSSGDYAGAPIGNGGNTTAAATVNKTIGIVFENGAGTVCGDVTLDGSYNVPAGYTLNIPAGASLSGSGTLSGGSAFTTENLTADMISVPTNLYYDGKDRTEYLTTELSGGLDKGITICGQTFTVSGWTLAVAKTDDLHYTATYTNNNDNTNTFTKTITLQKSGTDLTEGKVQTYKGDTLTKDFTAGDTITVKATPTPTGDAPQKAAARLRADPTEGQMAVFVGDTQVSVPADKGEDGSYTMEVSASDVLTLGGVEPNGDPITLTAKFVGNDNMADGAGTVEVSISAVAVAEKDGKVIGYYGESNLADAFEDSGNADATFTLLADVERTNTLTIKVNCTLDLGGHNITFTGTEYVWVQGPVTAMTIRGEGEIISEQSHALVVIGSITLEGGTFTSNGGNSAGVYVNSADASLSVTGEYVTIRNTGGGYGLAVNYAQSVQLSAGTYKGEKAVSIVSGTTTLGDLLDGGCAYHSGDTPIALEAGGKELTGTVMVKACTHTGEGVCTYTHNENTSTHTKTCLACGQTWTAENCTYTFSGATGTCAACGDSVTVAVSGTENLIYDGTEKKPGVTVMRGETALTAGTDYTVAYTDNKNAGENKATVTVTIGNGQGTYTENFIIGKATLYVAPNSQTIRYGESIREGASAILTRGLATGDHAVGVTLTPDTKDVPGGKIIASEVQIQNESGADVTGNYEITYVPGNLTINPVDVKLTFNDQTITYGDTPTLATADPTSAKIEYSYTTGEGGEPISGWPTNAGTYTVTAKVEATGNYGEASETATLTINPKAVSKPTIELSPNTFVYDGTGKEPAVTVKDGEKVIPADEYTVGYSNNINAGTATVTITNVAGNYTVSGTTTFAITAKPLTGAKVEVTGTFTYTGSAQEPAPTVTLDGKTLTANADYTVAYADNTNAGTAKITVTGMGNYSGTAQGTFTIGRADLTADGTGIASGTYGDKLSGLTVSGLTAKLGEATVTGTWKLTGDTVPNVGDSGEYTATFTPATGADNYNALTAQVKLNIAQATAPAPQTGTLNVQNGHAREYTYDLSRLLPVLTSGQSFGGDVTYTLKTVNITEAGYYDIDTAAISGTTLTLPVKAVTSSDEGQIGTITVTLSSKNFADVDATINVKRVNKQPVSIEGVTAQNGTYNGGTHNGYTGTPTASPYSGGFKVTYAKADGTALSGAPTNAGDYTVTFSLDPNDTYTGSRTLSFTIGKASITITADDKRADVGTAKPALTYTVTGLASGDTLTTEPTLTCDADMNTIGQYPITASGAAVPSGGNYNTAITYVPGTLSVTDPTIPVTGVTLNKTSLGLTVGGSERLTATVTPSNATDKSVTWTSSNTAVATVDSSGNVTAIGAGNAAITVTTADGTKTATCAVTVSTNSSGSGGGSGGGGGGTTTSPTVTVPVSGDKSTVHVSASVSGTTATVSKIDTSQIENVIGDNGQASMVEIDFTGLGKTIDTVKLPAAAIKDIAAKAQNEEVGGLTVKLPEAEISFDANALSAIQAQAGSQITLTVTPAKPADLNNRQKEAVGSAPVFDLTLRSSSGAITDFRGGYATVSLPYTLAAGQNPSGVVVYYLDSTGNITPCTTMYDVRSKSAIFTTGHLSLYFVGYDPTAVWVNPFSDVAEGAWYYDAVRYASENGLMGGYGNGKFGPNDNLSRAQFAQILFNKEGRPVVNYLLQYGDVATGAWYTEAVRWATSQGIVGGYGNGMFGPNDNITREQLAVMLWRYAGSPAATDKELHFTDADKASGYALEALRWAVENGVVNGYGNGQLAPQGLATRAQVAQMLKNFLEGYSD